MLRIEYGIEELYIPSYETEECGEVIENNPFVVVVFESITGRPIHSWMGNDRVLLGHIQPRPGVSAVREMLFERLYSWGWICLHGTFRIPEGAIVPKPILKRLAKIEGRKANSYLFNGGDWRDFPKNRILFPFFFDSESIDIKSELFPEVLIEEDWVER